MKQTLLILSFLVITGSIIVSAYGQTINIPQQGVRYDSDCEKKPEISVGVFNNRLYINGASEHSKLEIKNMLGDKVYETRLNSDKEKIYLDLKKGLYIVRIDNFLQRIVIK